MHYLSVRIFSGELSEAMILAADTTVADGSVVVRTLIPPSGSVPGDIVFLSGGSSTGIASKQIKTDEWKKIVEKLSVQVSLMNGIHFLLYIWY